MNPDEFSEDEIKVSALQLKIDGTDARKNIEEIRNTYAAPAKAESSEQPKESYFNQDWMNNMQRETKEFEGLEFDLGNGKNFNFGVGEGWLISRLTSLLAHLLKLQIRTILVL